MSKAVVIACDGGCGATAAQGGKHPSYPPGWLRLTVTGRRAGGTSSGALGVVDVDRPECAPAALRVAAELVSLPEVDR